MGLQCSILGHAFEPAGVEREREEQGSEVVTTEREIERCRRCGTERVVSESTEVAAVIEGEDVGLDGPGTDDEAAGTDTDAAPGGGIAGAIGRSGVDEDDESDDAGTERSTTTDTDDRETMSRRGEDDLLEDEPPNPEAEDAEILTDDESTDSDRAPGQWPDDVGAGEDTATDDETNVADSGDDIDVEDATVETPDEESLSGITVPEGEIVCPNCGFRIEARSGYREGDSCPECNAWLEAERNQ